MTINNYEFKNGLKLVYQQKSGANITGINFFVNVGSQNESEELNGISHLIEHMVFKGTKKLPKAKDISKIFDQIGAYFNAYTYIDLTCYIVKCDSDYTKKCICTLCDMLLNSNFRKDEFEREKNVIVDEIIRAQDNTEGYVNEKIYSILFKGSNLANPIGGIPETIRNYDYNSALDYYKYFYRPSNIVISICSNKPFDEIRKIVETCDLATYVDTPPEEKKYIMQLDEINHTDRRQGKIFRQLEQTYMAIGFKTVGKYHSDYYGLNLLKYILTGNMSSIFFINLREKNGLTYNISVDLAAFEKTGAFTILTSVDDAKLIKYTENNKVKPGALPIIFKILRKITTECISQEQLDIAKGFMKGSTSLESEDALNVCGYNGRNILFDLDDKNYTLYENYNKRYKDITLENINIIIKKYITFDRLNTFYIGKTLDNNIIQEISNVEDKLKEPYSELTEQKEEVVNNNFNAVNLSIIDYFVNLF